MGYQSLEKNSIADNVLEYAVSLASKTRPNTKHATPEINNFISWGAGPRASQYLVLGANVTQPFMVNILQIKKMYKAIAEYVLRHRIVQLQGRS